MDEIGVGRGAQSTLIRHATLDPRSMMADILGIFPAGDTERLVM
jgi:hypothetical protein